MIKSSREKALYLWNKLDDKAKQMFADQYNSIKRLGYRDHKSLTGREIEEFWNM